MKTITLYLLLLSSMSCRAVVAHKVVLLHGLTKTSKSMKRIQRALEDRGYDVLNIDYPSRKHRIEVLADMVRDRLVSQCQGIDTIHFVTHSMGGIILRQIQKEAPIDNIGRVVMLSPPSQGSEAVDKLRSCFIFEWIYGPAGAQLGIMDDGFLGGLGKIDFELGIIAGDRSFDLLLSFMIPGKDDGKVSVERAKARGMKDFRVVHATHSSIMKNRRVVKEIAQFLDTGHFSRPL